MSKSCEVLIFKHVSFASKPTNLTLIEVKRQAFAYKDVNLSRKQPMPLHFEKPGSAVVLTLAPVMSSRRMVEVHRCIGHIEIMNHFVFCPSLKKRFQILPHYSTSFIASTLKLMLKQLAHDIMNHEANQEPVQVLRTTYYY